MKKWHNNMNGMIVDLNSFNKFVCEANAERGFYCVYGIDNHAKYEFAYFDEEEEAEEYLHTILQYLLNPNYVPTETFWFNDPKFKEKMMKKAPPAVKKGESD